MKDFLDHVILDLDHGALKVENLFIILIIFGLIQILIIIFSLVLKRSFKTKSKEDIGKRYTIMKLIRYVLYTIGIVLSLQSLGINVTALVVGSAALLVGIGLGLQDIFKDFVSGLVILFEGVIRVGQVIEVDNIVAKVMHIDLRTSKVMTRDGNYIILPNSRFVNGSLINWSMEDPVSRFHIDVGVAYGSDTELVRDLLIQCAKNNEHVLQHLPIRADFMEFGDSSLNFKLLFWAERQWEIPVDISNIRFAIDKAFRENGVTIPFPQRDVHLKST